MGADFVIEDPDAALTVDQVSDDPPGVAEPARLVIEDPDAALTVDQVSDDPPDVVDAPLSLTGRVPATIDAHAPPSAPGAIDLAEQAANVPLQPPTPGESRGLSPRVAAIAGAALGVAAIATVLAVLIQIDGPRRGLPAALGSRSASSPEATPPPSAPAASSEPAPPPAPEVFRVQSLEADDSVRVAAGKLGSRSLTEALEEEKVPAAQIARILRAFGDAKVFDRPKRKHQYVVALDKATKRVKAFEYLTSVVDVWQAKETDDGALAGAKLDLQVETSRVAKSVFVKEDLKQAIVDAGFDDDLLDTLNDALEDRISLSRLGKGSTLRVVAKEQRSFGRFARYVDVEAVEFWTPKSERPTRLYHFKGDKSRGYFDEAGKAPYKGGWRYPVKFPRVTSRFNPKRMHPVLHVVSPHNGTDFGAPTGTPIYAVSHGTVTWVGPHGPSGNLVVLSHSNGIETGYAHMSKFAPNLKRGDKVETRQVIGFVGTTGRSTGPHLHFSVKKNGVFVDGLQVLKMDGERVLPPSEREAFGAWKSELDKVLDALPLPDRGAGAAPAAPAASDDDDDGDDNHGEDAPAKAPSAAPAAPAAPAPEEKRDEEGSAVWRPF
ncbi:MAG: M23 family metallopeptidase [Polyangiaceae bacterium]|nr:M23 family metallopeptidase [Polyangiaceae bacterium]